MEKKLGYKFNSFYLTLITLVFVSNIAIANDAEIDFIDKIPDKVLKSDDKFITVAVENDSLGSGDDQNYTSGIMFRYYDTSRKSNRFLKNLKTVAPFLNFNKTTSTYISLGQNLYTPSDITLTTEDFNDRPYAGFLYGSIGATTINPNSIDEVEVIAGVVGPWAIGEITQKTVHGIIGADKPRGWDFQLKNEPAFNVAFQRMWPEAYAQEFGPVYLRLAPYTGVTLGNVYTHGLVGANVQLTPTKYKWQSTPLRVRPSIPGTGYFNVPDDAIAWSLFGGVEGRAVARNIFLDGNTFRDSASVDKKHFVADVSGGFSVSYGNIQTSYSLTWRSKEFEKQKENSIFGAVSVGYRF